MKITSIRQQVKNTERANIFIEGKYTLSLSLNELVEQKLKPNLEIDEARLKSLKKISEDGKLRIRSMEWSLNRPRSLKEFQGYMRRKGADPELISKLQEEFQAKDYLSDSKFATWLVELRRRSGKSERAIKAELISKGINHSHIDQIMSDNGNELDRLKKLILKKHRISRYAHNPDKFKQYLLRQGFSYQDIKTALED